MNLIHSIYEPIGGGLHPTLLTLHGFGANTLDLLGLAPHLSGGKFLVVCPQGPFQVPISDAAVGYGWFPITGAGPINVQAVLDAREQLKTFLADAFERYPIDPKRLAIVGFSQGGVMAYSLGLCEPERYAGLAALSSWLPKDLLSTFPDVPATEQLPVLIQHGSQDELVDVGRARQSVETLQNVNVPLTYREYEMGHQINAESLGDLSNWLQEKVLSPDVLDS